MSDSVVVMTACAYLSTVADPQARVNAYIDDPIVRLRAWGTESAYPLPEPRVPFKLGSGPKCEVQLCDKARRLSREHAELVPDASGWEIRDLASKNGLWVDGVRTASSVVRAGSKLQLGGLMLVAESIKFIALRALVCRLLGWGSARQVDVDEALQNLRDSALQRTPLVLLGTGKLAPVAERLNEGTYGPRVPFYVYEGGDVAEAVRASMQGTLCAPIRTRQQASAMLDAVHAVDSTLRPRLILCVNKAAHITGLGTKPGRFAVIALPALSKRSDETLRLVLETASILVQEMKTKATGFTPHDLERLQGIKFAGMADLEDTLRRLIALRMGGGVANGAKQLGITHASLSVWARAKKRRFCT